MAPGEFLHQVLYTDSMSPIYPQTIISKSGDPLLVPVVFFVAWLVAFVLVWAGWFGA